MQRVEHAGRGTRVRRSLVAHAVDRVAVRTRDEPLLERKQPLGVSSQVRSGSSVAGRIVAWIPSAAASRAVTADSGVPSRRACVRTRCRPRSRSPSRNHDFAAEGLDRCERVPRLVGPPPAALLVGEAGERVQDAVQIRARRTRPSTSRSSPTLTIAVTFAGSTASNDPRRKRAPPTPPLSTATLTKLSSSCCRAACVCGTGPEHERVRGRRACRRRPQGSARRRRPPRARGLARRAGNVRRCAARTAARTGAAAREAERVRPTVLGGDEGNAAERRGTEQRAEVVRRDAGDVRVHDENRVRGEEPDCSGDRAALAAPGSSTTSAPASRATPAAVLVRSDDDRAADLRGRGEDVGEHGQHHCTVSFLAQAGQTLLACAAAERYDDGGHLRRLSPVKPLRERGDRRAAGGIRGAARPFRLRASTRRARTGARRRRSARRRRRSPSSSPPAACRSCVGSAPGIAGRAARARRDRPDRGARRARTGGAAGARRARALPRRRAEADGRDRARARRSPRRRSSARRRAAGRLTSVPGIGPQTEQRLLGRRSNASSKPQRERDDC